MNRELRQLLDELRVNRITMLKAMREDVRLKVKILRRTIENTATQVTC